MDIIEVMKSRHSVRRYTEKQLDHQTIDALNKEIAVCNGESGLNIQLITDDPETFSAEKPSYGQFKGCRNYLALIGKKDKDEEIGYYGERIVLLAQFLGINSCWVALTYRKGKAKAIVAQGEKLHMVIALGYGETQGVPHRSKSAKEIGNCSEDSPEWYKKGIDAVLLAPTAVNQQKFRFSLSDGKVTAKAGVGFYTKTDLGIAKYHFEAASGKGPEIWN